MKYMQMKHFTYVGKNIPRVDLKDKAYGKALYTTDQQHPGTLSAALHISTSAHARLQNVNISKALESPGVHAVLTGEDFPYPVGPMLADRPPIAYQKVRYYGEPIAVVVADSEYQAKYAASL